MPKRAGGSCEQDCCYIPEDEQAAKHLGVGQHLRATTFVRRLVHHAVRGAVCQPHVRATMAEDAKHAVLERLGSRRAHAARPELVDEEDRKSEEGIAIKAPGHSGQPETRSRHKITWVQLQWTARDMSP